MRHNMKACTGGAGGGGGKGKTPVTTACPDDCLGYNVLRVDISRAKVIVYHLQTIKGHRQGCTLFFLNGCGPLVRVTLYLTIKPSL